MVNSQYHINQRTTKINDLYNKEPAIDIASLNKIFIGKVRDTRDPQKMGRILVWIPELSGSPDDPDNWFVASYCSPFAGASFLDINLYNDSDSRSNAVDDQRNLTDPSRQPTNLKGQLGGRQSYGMWFVPPDIGNDVIVTFVRGDSTSCIWMGSLYGQNLNHMVPGIASASVSETEESLDTDDTYGPVIETDLRDDKNLKSDNPERKKYSPLFNGLKKQGLNNDILRGLTTSSARRESPSQTFGILTPGGNQFVMDDGTINYSNDPSHPGGNALIRLRTKSGTQILLDETTGSIYAITRDGLSWIELNNDGNIDIYGKSNISIHSESGNVNIKTSGTNNDINIQSGRDINMYASRHIRAYSGGETDFISEDSFTVNTGNKTSFISANDMAIEVRNNDANLGISVANDINIQTPGGKIITYSNDDLIIRSDSNISIQSGNYIKIDSGEKIGINAAADIGIAGTNISANASGQLGLQANGQAAIQGSTVELNSAPPNIVSQPTTIVTPVPGPQPENANGSPIYDGVPGIAISNNPVEGPWQAGDNYESGTNIIPRVPQHEPWNARNTKDATGTNGLVVEGDINAKLGSTSSTADKPLTYINSTGSVYSGVGYKPDGTPIYVIDNNLSDISNVVETSSLKSSDNIKTIIKEYETPYSTIAINAAGQKIIGYGHVLTEEEISSGIYNNVTLSNNQIEELFENDLAKSEEIVRQSITTNLTQGQFDALTSLNMNIGEQEFKNSEIVKSVNSQQLEKVPTLFSKWSNIRTPAIPPVTSLSSLPEFNNLGTSNISNVLKTPTIPTIPGVPLVNMSNIPTASSSQITSLSGLVNKRNVEAQIFSQVSGNDKASQVIKSLSS